MPCAPVTVCGMLRTSPHSGPNSDWRAREIGREESARFTSNLFLLNHAQFKRNKFHQKRRSPFIGFLCHESFSKHQTVYQFNMSLDGSKSLRCGESATSTANPPARVPASKPESPAAGTGTSRPPPLPLPLLGKRHEVSSANSSPQDADVGNGEQLADLPAETSSSSSTACASVKSRKQQRRTPNANANADADREGANSHALLALVPATTAADHSQNADDRAQVQLSVLKLLPRLELQGSSATYQHENDVAVRHFISNFTHKLACFCPEADSDLKYRYLALSLSSADVPNLSTLSAAIMSAVENFDSALQHDPEDDKYEDALDVVRDLYCLPRDEVRLHELLYEAPDRFRIHSGTKDEVFDVRMFARHLEQIFREFKIDVEHPLAKREFLHMLPGGDLDDETSLGAQVLIRLRSAASLAPGGGARGGARGCRLAGLREYCSAPWKQMVDVACHLYEHERSEDW